MLKQLTSRGVKLLLVQPNSLRMVQSMDFSAIVNTQMVSTLYQSHSSPEIIWTKEKEEESFSFWNWI